MKIHDKTSATSSLRTKWWQKLGFLLAAGLFVLGSSPTQAQVSYSESWDVPGLAGWVNGAGTGGSFARFTGATDCDGNGSVRANQWSAGQTREFISPLTGTSNGAVTTLTFDYKYAIWIANEVGANATSFTLEVFWGTSASGPWNSLGIIDAGNHTVSGTCAQGPGTYTFTPDPGDPVYIRFFSTRLDQDYYVNLDNVVVEELLPVCTSVPAPGNTESSVVSACTDNPFTLSLENPPGASGVSYQWQTSPDGLDWTDAGPDAATWETSQSADTYYRCEVTCDGEGTGISTALLIEMDTPVNCICIPSYTFGVSEGDLISNVVIPGTTLSNNSGTSTAGPDYTYYNTLPNHTADLQAGTSYNIEVTIGSFTNQNIAVWIDLNGDGTFDPSERVGFAGPVNTAFGTVSFPISIPCDPDPGVKRMRIRTVWNLAPNLIDPCATYGYGETEDYDVTILDPPACPSPIGLVASNETTNSVLLNWNQGCAETAWEVEYGPIGFTPGDGTTVPAGTNVNFELSGLDDDSAYDVYVRSDCGLDGVSSNLGPVSFSTTAFPPANDLCEDAIMVACGSVTSGTTNAATTTNAPPGFCVGSGALNTAGGVWYTVEGFDGLMFASLCGSPFDTKIGVFSGSCGAFTCVAGNDDDGGAGGAGICGGGVVSSVSWEGSLSETYYVYVTGFGTATGAFDLTIGCIDAIDDCANDFSSSPNLPIADVSTTTNDIIVGSQVGGSIITDMDVQIGLDHTFVADLTITLTSPCGTEVVLFDGQCGGADDMVAIFDDSADDDIATWCSLRYGPVIPQEALSAFNNEPIEGTWTLSITDNFAGDVGTLLNWCLIPTLEDLCVTPQIVITDFSDTTIEVDIADGGCFDTGNYESFNINWGTGSVSGITTLPYEITGLDPGTNYNVILTAVCTGANPSGSTAISQFTLNCTVEEVCTYELTLANSSGNGFDGAFVQVNNGWFTADYTLSGDQSENTFTIQACPGNSLSLSLVNDGNGALASNYSVSLVNASNTPIYNENGPPEALLYFTDDGCPDCASVLNIQTTRLASDLVEVTWSNIELAGNVNDILVEVYFEDFFGNETIIGSETVAAGSTFASVPLDGLYAFTDVVVRVSTNCANDAVAQTNAFTTLPECAAADQCEYAFNMTSTGSGWGNFGLDIMLGFDLNFTLALESGSSGSQSVFACEGETLSVSANNPEESPAGCLNFQFAPWPTGGLNPVCGGAPATVTDAWTTEYSTVDAVGGNEYIFSSTENVGGAPNFITISNSTGTTVLAAGMSPLAYYVPSNTSLRFYSHNNDACDGNSASLRTRSVSCAASAPPFTCDAVSFSLFLNPSDENVELIANTDFCNYDDNETVFSGTTCPSCYAATNVNPSNETLNSVDVTWNSVNPAGTSATIYVGLPGFDPLVDPVSTETSVSAATGPQGPVTVGGLNEATDYEVIIIEDCDPELADASLPVPFSTAVPSPCVEYDPPTEVTAEGEPCGEDTNGGCNSPNPSFSSIDCGETVAGIGWATGGTRDTDWYQFVTTEGGEININAIAEFPFVVGVVFDFDNCDAIDVLDLFELGEACEEITLSGIVGAGIHTVFIAPQVFEGYPCGSNANNYWVTLDADICTEIVAPANDECTAAQPLAVTPYPTSNLTLGTLEGANVSGTGPFCAGLGTRDVFYSFSAPTANHYFVNLNGIGSTNFVLELYDECSGTLVECIDLSANPETDCGQAQDTPGFPSDSACQDAVCAQDSFCCDTSWDGICAGIASTDQEAACAGCLGGQSQSTELVLDLPAGNYVIRVGNATGLPVVGTNAQFLIGVQSFPTAQVQDNPANWLYACNTTNRQLEDIVGASPQSGQIAGVLDYEWLIYPQNEGPASGSSWVRGAPNYATILTWLGMEYGKTYNVYVRMLLNIPGQGPVWGVFQINNGFEADPSIPGASICTIGMSNEVTLTQLRPNFSPTNSQGNDYALCDIASAFTVAEAQNYEWEFNDGIDTVYYVRGAGNPHVKLSWVNCLKPNALHQVRVRAQVAGQWGAFGTSMPLSTAPTANTALRANMCNTTRGLNQFILAENVCAHDGFQYRLTNVDDNTVHIINSIGTAGAGFLNTAVPALVPGATYSVEVKATQCGVEGDFSTACNLTIAGPQAQGDETPALRDMAANGSSLYPNPNAGSEVRLELHGIGDGAHDVNVVIYDIYGKMISSTNFGHEGTNLSRLIRFDGNLAMGMYMVHVLIDGEQFAVERMVVK